MIFLGLQQPAIGGKADTLQGRQIVQPLADIEVVAVIDGRFGS